MATKVGARHHQQRCSTVIRSHGRDSGVSEVVGSIIMVGITVTMAAAFVLFILAANPGPVDTTHTDLAMSVDRGTGGWGDGDERVVISHRGGEALYSNTTVVRISVGAVITDYTGPTLTFSDDDLVVGESWAATMTIPPDSAVSVTVVESQGDPAVLTTGSLRSGTLDCSTDTTAPTVSAFNTDPSDVTAITSEKVEVSFKVHDNCSGVDATATAASGHLKYRIPGSSDLDAWTTTPIQQIGTSAFWNATIPVTDWSTYDGLTLKMIVENVADSAATPNTGNSSTFEELVQSATTYITGCTPFTGTVSTCPGAMAADDGTVETLTEGSTTVTSDITLDGDGTVDPGIFTEATADDGCVSNSAWATASTGGGSDPGLAAIRCGITDSSGTGTISQVEAFAMVKTNDASKGEWRFQACETGGGPCGGQSANIQVSQSNTDTIISYVLPTAPDGSPTWTWTDVDNVEIEVQPRKTGGGGVTFEIERVWIVVTEGSPAYDLNIRADVDGITVGSTYTLQLGYRAEGEDFRVEVWDFVNGEWNTRGALLDSTSLVDWPSYTLTADEVNTDHVRVRFIDQSPGDASESYLHLDYIRVVST